MLKVPYGQSFSEPLVLAAGFFDCVHLGHAAVIKRAKAIARELGALTAVFTFSDDAALALGKKRQIYGFEDRTEAFSDLGADVVIHARFSDVVTTPARRFLDVLCDTLNVKGAVAGEDYTFGARAGGNAAIFADYFAEHGCIAEILPFVTADGCKIASTNIKSAVENGDVESVNRLLAEPYFMTGTVSHAHGRGKCLGFPTANLPLPCDRLPLGEGVYATKLTVSDNYYVGITNVGGRPTFGESSPSVETFILGFDGDLYGKRIKLSFYKKLRDIVRFDSGEALAAQLQRDCDAARNVFSEE